MPISPLPDDTVRLLGSAAVITTPIGLVKELLENAIDAGATCIDILISQNTVDRIEVRDNGSGIHPDDYECLGRPGHTSKLTSFEELRTIGATTFGFRGQALASANSMGNVVVTTRTLQDSTGFKLELRHGVGGVESQERASAPVGTAVSVTALFSRLPVRQQVVLKEAQKSILNIKHLLHAYALARPQVRLSFKIMGKNPTQSWSYSPRPQATIKEAVVQIFGTGLMSQCMLQTLATEVGIETDISHDGPEFVIEAVLPKPDADFSKLSKGSFFSIDSRPITTLRGTGRHMIQIFRTHFEKAWGVNHLPRASNNLFIRINIKCSPGTYDPNIEPLKDQVIFANEPEVIDLFERLCTEAYKAKGTRSAFVTIEKRPLIRRTQTRTPPPSSGGPEGDEPSILDATLNLEDTAGGVNIHPPQSPMSSYSSPLHPHVLGTDTKPTQQPGGIGLPRDSPFPRHACESPLMAGMLDSSISQCKPRTRQPQLDHASPGDITIQDVNIVRSRTEMKDIRNEQVEPATNAVPQHGGREDIPCQAVTAFDQSRKRGFVVDMSVDPNMSSDEETEMLALRFRGQQDRDSQLEASNEHSKEGLNPWVIAKMSAPTRKPVANDNISVDIVQSLSHCPKSEILGVGETSEEELPVLRPRKLGGPPGDLHPHRTTRTGILGVRDPSPAANIGVSQAFYSPPNYDMPWPPLQLAKSDGRYTLPDLRGHRNEPDENVDPDGLVQLKLSFGGPRARQEKQHPQPQMHINDVPAKPNPSFRKPKRPNGGSHAGQDSRTSGFPGDTSIDTRHRIEHSRSLRKDDSRAESSYAPRLAPLRSPEDHAAPHTHAPNPDTGNAEDIRIDEGPREYLMRRQRSEAEHRGRARQSIKRTMTDKVPLETIPQGQEIQHLVLVVKADTKNLRQNQIGVKEGEAVDNGGLCTNLDLEDVVEIEKRLKNAVFAWAEDTLDEKAEVAINLRKVVKGKGIAT